VINYLKSRIQLKNQIAIITYLIILLSIKSSNTGSSLPIGNDLFWWTIQSVFVYILYALKNRISSAQVEKNFFLLKIYVFWSFVCILRGAYVADNYWEWKFLISHSYVLLLPLIAYLANSVFTIQLITKTWLKYGVWLFLLLFPFFRGDAIGRFLIPFSFLIFFLPILSTRWKITVVLVSIFVISYDASARSNLIKFIVPCVIVLLYYARNIIYTKLFNGIRLTLLVLPILFLVLGISNVFNIFKMDEYISGDYYVEKKTLSGRELKQSLTTDTRTFLYVEVLQSAIKNNYIFFGRTPARGNDSKSFGSYNKNKLGTGKNERFGNEVSILNVFTWMGFVGVVLYFLVFFRATYLAINESNNIFIKLIGINISFRWVYGFVEDFSDFDLNNIFLWIMIGMCFSKSFRLMTNSQMKNWVSGFFEEKKSKKNIYPAI
jgi:hypothetical protein